VLWVTQHVSARVELGVGYVGRAWSNSVCSTRSLANGVQRNGRLNRMAATSGERSSPRLAARSQSGADELERGARIPRIDGARSDRELGGRTPAASSYRTPVDDGVGGSIGNNLQRVAALIAAGLPTRLYYVTYGGNSFDTHVQQADLSTAVC
jgi:hypothetical protein